MVEKCELRLQDGLKPGFLPDGAEIGLFSQGLEGEIPVPAGPLEALDRPPDIPGEGQSPRQAVMNHPQVTLDDLSGDPIERLRGG